MIAAAISISVVYQPDSPVPNASKAVTTPSPSSGASRISRDSLVGSESEVSWVW